AGGDAGPQEERRVFGGGVDPRLEPIALGIHDERRRDGGAFGEQAAGHRLAQRASPPGHERDAAGEAHSAAGIAMMAERWMSSYRTLPTSNSARLSRSFLNVCSKDGSVLRCRVSGVVRASTKFFTYGWLIPRFLILATTMPSASSVARTRPARSSRSSTPFFRVVLRNLSTRRRIGAKAPPAKRLFSS